MALNRERMPEEAAGRVRWLRPSYQAPAEVAQAARKEQFAMAMDADAVLPAWPKAVRAQDLALRAALARTGRAGPADLAQHFRGVRPAKLAPMLKALAAMGQAREAGGGCYVAWEVTTAADPQLRTATCPTLGRLETNHGHCCPHLSGCGHARHTPHLSTQRAALSSARITNLLTLLASRRGFEPLLPP